MTAPGTVQQALKQSALRILYVDDEPDVRLITMMGLRRDSNMDIRDVGSGAAALALLAEGDWQPDLLLLDVMMPEMSGPVLLMAIRASQATRETPVIFITARVGTVARDEYLGLGAIGVIPKPYQVLHLAESIRAILGTTLASAV